MTDQLGTHARDDGITSGSDTRPARELRSPQVVDLLAEASGLFDEPEWAEGDRNSRTIATSERMRVTLTGLRAGGELGSRGNDDSLAIQVLRGGGRLEIDAGSADLREGSLATMAEPGAWRLRAVEDSLFLLIVAVGADEPGGR